MIQLDTILDVPLLPDLARAFGQFGVFLIRPVSSANDLADIVGSGEGMRQRARINQDDVVPRFLNSIAATTPLIPAPTTTVFMQKAILPTKHTNNRKIGDQLSVFHVLVGEVENDFAARRARAACSSAAFASLNGYDFSTLVRRRRRLAISKIGLNAAIRSAGVALSYHLLIQMPRNRRSLKIRGRSEFSAAANSSRRS
jgi:hypothetical protein